MNHAIVGGGRAQILPMAILLTAFVFDRAFIPRWPGFAKLWSRLSGTRWWRFVPAIFLMVVLTEPTVALTAAFAWLHPVAAALFAVASMIAVAIRIRRGAWWPDGVRPDPIFFALILCYAGMASHGYVAFGSTERESGRVEMSVFLKPVLTRAQFVERGEEWASAPGSVAVDSVDDRLFFTLRRWNRGPGRNASAGSAPTDAIGVMRLSDPIFRSDRLIRIGDSQSEASPGRIAVNPARHEVYALIHRAGGPHSVWIFEYGSELDLRKSIDLDFEPRDVTFDETRLIVAGREGTIGTYDLATGKPIKYRHLGDIGFPGSLARLEFRPDKPLYFASVFSRNFLSLDARYFNTIKVAKIGVPTEGVAFDAQNKRVYAAAPLTREVLVIDAESPRIIDRIDVGGVVREVALDSTRRIVLATAWADGRIVVIDLDTNRVVASVVVGRPAFSVHVVPMSGQIFATSSCGLFEVLIDDLLESRGFVKRGRASIAAPTQTP